jgi:hypothetical protein
MDDAQIRQMIEDSYDDSKEDTLRAMVGQFYNKKMLSTVILVWAYGLVFMALAIFSGVKFFRAGDIRSQIMYAGLFLCGVQMVALIKIFAWQMIHRNSIKREIKRLEIRVAELKETVESKGA